QEIGFFETALFNVLDKALVRLVMVLMGFAVLKRLRDPVDHSLVVHLDVQVFDFVNKENAVACFSVDRPHLAIHFIVLGPFTISERVMQDRLPVRILVLGAMNRLPVNHADVVVATSTATAAPASPALVGIEIPNETDDHHRADENPQRFLVFPNLCKHTGKSS